MRDQILRSIKTCGLILNTIKLGVCCALWILWTAGHSLPLTWGKLPASCRLHSLSTESQLCGSTKDRIFSLLLIYTHLMELPDQWSSCRLSEVETSNSLGAPEPNFIDTAITVMY